MKVDDRLAAVELLEDRRERLLDVREVHDPSELRIDGAGNVDFDAKRMAVQARALVAGRNGGQAMRRLESVLLGQLDVHAVKATTPPRYARSTSAAS